MIIVGKHRVSMSQYREWSAGPAKQGKPLHVWLEEREASKRREDEICWAAIARRAAAYDRKFYILSLTQPPAP